MVPAGGSSREQRAGDRAFDIAGFVLSAGAGPDSHTLGEGHGGWTSPRIIACGLIGLIAAIAMTVVELRIHSPMLELRLLGNRMFRQCNLVSMFSIASFLGVTFVMPLYLQLIRGLSPLNSGLTTFPQAFGIMASSLIAGRLYSRIGPRRLMSGGLIGAALAISLYIQLGLDTSLWLIRALMFGRGLCMGFAFVPMQAASYATIAPSQNGRASSIFSTQRQVGVSLGVAIMASILAAHMSLSRPPLPDEVASALTGVRWAFGVAVLSPLAGVLPCSSATKMRGDDVARGNRHGGRRERWACNRQKLNHWPRLTAGSVRLRSGRRRHLPAQRTDRTCWV